DSNYLSPELTVRVVNDVRTLCTALGYDLNTVEFAIKDGVPYAIDFMNPAPDAELKSVGEFYHRWVTDAVCDLVFKRLAEPKRAPAYRWDALLNPAERGDEIAHAVGTALSVVESATEQAASILPEAVREIGAEVQIEVTKIVDELTAAVETVIKRKPKTIKV